MALLKDEDREQLVKVFSEHLAGPVKIVMFTQAFECEFCTSTRELVQELVDTHDDLSLEVLDFVADKEKAALYEIDKIPALVLLDADDKDYGIRFYGIPAGYEFTSLIEDILDVAKGESILTEAVKEELDKVTEPVHIQVFVSPTCPYCPPVVRAAHKFAMYNKNIIGDMVEVAEFPYLSNKYDVQGVPKAVFNDDFELTGAQPELDLAKKAVESQKAVN